MKQTKRTRTRIPRFLLALSITGSFTISGHAQDAESAEDEDIFELSPFEVTASQDVGYRATNTLAGSRLNTNLADIGASITVVTKQQMEDTASTDLNDMFRYEAGTEGSSTYTPAVQSFRNDGIVDVNAGFAAGNTGVAQTNATANTVRGLGSPDSSINFYRSIRQIPLDSYNVQSIEISRGPNSMLFGIGTPAGVVNQTRSSAALTEDQVSVKLRFDDLGSKRGSVSWNKVLIDEKLAFFGALLRDEKEFARKPSYDNSDRMFATITYKPFENTKISGSFEYYDNENSRPNTLTPRDGVSKWLSDGRPVYDSSTLTMTQLDTGKTVPIVRHGNSLTIDRARDYIMSLPAYDASLWNDERTQYNGIGITGSAWENADSPFYIPGIAKENSRPVMQFANGRVANFFQGEPGRYRPVWGTPEDPTENADYTVTNEEIRNDPVNAPVTNQIWTSNAWWGAPQGELVGNYLYPGVTDRSIYDWEEHNLLAMNWGKENAKTYNIEFEQRLREDLHFSAGWFRQDFTSNSSFTVSQLNAAILRVDTNVSLPDGSPNPYVGGVYMEDQDPDRFLDNVKNDQYRAILAYTPDFTGRDGWTRWLGKHQFVGFASREDEKRQSTRNRFAWLYESEEADVGMIRFLPNPNDNADGTPTGFVNNRAILRRQFYLSEPNRPQSEWGSIDTTSEQDRRNQFTVPMNVYNWENKQWQDVSYTGRFKPFSSSTQHTKIDSWNIGGSSYLWNDRIVATYGVRSDKASNRGTTDWDIVDSDGNIIEERLPRADVWMDGNLNVPLVANRFVPWQSISEETSTFGFVARPFSKWDSIESKAKSGNLLAQFVGSLGFTYNNSETFNPPTSINVDPFGTPLPKPGGEGEDYGIQFSLFDNKFFARITRYESSNVNEHTSLGSAGSRFINQVDQNQFRTWAGIITKINWGWDPTDGEAFNRDLTEEERVRFEEEAGEIWGQEYGYYGTRGGSINGTQDVAAKGTELELTFNPMPNWTMKFTGSKQETVYSNVIREYLDWKAHRLPALQSATASDYLLPQYQSLATYTRENERVVDLTNFWTSYGYTDEARLDHPNGYTSVESYYNAIVTPQEAVSLDLEGQVVTNQPKHQASFITNYRFTDGRFKGYSVGGSMRWIDEKSIGYYGKSSGDPDRPAGYLDLTDTTRPIYTDAQYYYDIWASYSRPIMDGKVDMKIQLNVVNAFEGGGLQTVGVNRDGSPYAFRIIEPRKYMLGLSFDM